MTQQTNYQLPTAELTQAGTFFANLGLECPWVGRNMWCYLEGECVYGDLLAEYDADKRHTENRAVRCPPAVVAAVVDFGQRVIELYWQTAPCTVLPDETEEGMWEWRLTTPGGAVIGDLCHGRLEAHTGLILAVAGEVGES